MHGDKQKLSRREKHKRRQKIIFAVMAAVLAVGLLGSSVAWMLGDTGAQIASSPAGQTAAQPTLADLQRQVQAHPHDAAAAARLAAAYADAGRLNEAATAYEKAVALAPHDGDLLVNLALDYFLLGQYDRAAARLTEEIRLHPDDARAYFYYGQVLGYGKKDYRGAVRQLEKFIRLAKTGDDVNKARQMIAQWQKLSGQ